MSRSRNPLSAATDARESEDRRTAWTGRLADHVLAEGLAGASLRSLAAAAGTSDRMLIYYFSDKAGVMAAALNEIATRLLAMLEAGRPPAPLPADQLETRLRAVILDEALWPYMRLWLEIAATAGRGDAFCRQIGGEIARGLLAWVEALIAAPDAAARARDALRLVATVEGLILLKSLGLGNLAARLD